MIRAASLRESHGLHARTLCLIIRSTFTCVSFCDEVRPSFPGWLHRMSPPPTVAPVRLKSWFLTVPAQVRFALKLRHRPIFIRWRNRRVVPAHAVEATALLVKPPLQLLRRSAIDTMGLQTIAIASQRLFQFMVNMPGPVVTDAHHAARKIVAIPVNDSCRCTGGIVYRVVVQPSFVEADVIFLLLARIVHTSFDPIGRTEQPDHHIAGRALQASRSRVSRGGLRRVHESLLTTECRRRVRLSPPSLQEIRPGLLSIGSAL